MLYLKEMLWKTNIWKFSKKYSSRPLSTQVIEVLTQIERRASIHIWHSQTKSAVVRNEQQLGLLTDIQLLLGIVVFQVETIIVRMLRTFLPEQQWSLQEEDNSESHG